MEKELEPQKIDEEFRKKLLELTDREIRKLDRNWNNLAPVLEKFYGGYYPKGKNGKVKKHKFIYYLYRYYILHPNHKWNEQY
ncbi:MAG: hypothetical protein ACP5RX_03330, partial [Minisyncoccia bacterium]